MEGIDYFNVFVRWLHVGGAILAVGSAMFALFVVLPAFHLIPEEVRPRVHEEMRRRMARLVMAAVALLLITGLYNYIRNEMPRHHDQGLYHGLMGVKILLAFGVFFISSALAGRSTAFETIRRRRARWLTLNVVLGLAVVLLGALLRALPDAAAPMQ